MTEPAPAPTASVIRRVAVRPGETFREWRLRTFTGAIAQPPQPEPTKDRTCAGAEIPIYPEWS